MRQCVLQAWVVVAAALWSTVPTRASAQAVPVGGEFQVNSYTTGRQEYQKIDCGGDGSFVVAWQGATTDNPGVFNTAFVARYDGSGMKLGTDFEFPTGMCATSRSRSKVCRDTSGDVVAVWQEAGIRGQRFDSSGSVLGTELQVSGGGSYPDVGCANDGDFVVIWQDYGTAAAPGSSRSASPVAARRWAPSSR